MMPSLILACVSRSRALKTPGFSSIRSFTLWQPAMNVRRDRSASVNVIVAEDFILFRVDTAMKSSSLDAPAEKCGAQDEKQDGGRGEECKLGCDVGEAGAVEHDGAGGFEHLSQGEEAGDPLHPFGRAF